MKHIIFENLERLEMHDSNIEFIIRNESEIEIHLDWCGLSDYKEKNFDDVIIIGNSILKIQGYHSDYFLIDYSGNPDFKNHKSENIFFDDFNPTLFNPVSENKIDDLEKVVNINGFYTHNGIFGWLYWSFKFEKISLTWENFLTREQWLKGKLPR